MPNPAFSELQKITEIVAKAQGLSPNSIRYVRATLLSLLKTADTTGSGEPDPDVAAAQKKTAELFQRPATGA